MTTTFRWTVDAACLLAFAVAFGCSEAPNNSKSSRTVDDSGKACVFNSNASPADGVDAGDAKIRVFIDACISSSCDTVTSKTCTASSDGSTITVQSSATIESRGGACTDDCGSVRVDCDVGSLDAGDYTLEHGSESIDFTVPSDDPTCAGSAPFGPTN